MQTCERVYVISLVGLMDVLLNRVYINEITGYPILEMINLIFQGMQTNLSELWKQSAIKHWIAKQNVTCLGFSLMKTFLHVEYQPLNMYELIDTPCKKERCEWGFNYAAKSFRNFSLHHAVTCPEKTIACQ